MNHSKGTAWILLGGLLIFYMCDMMHFPWWVGIAMFLIWAYFAEQGFKEPKEAELNPWPKAKRETRLEKQIRQQRERELESEKLAQIKGLPAEFELAAFPGVSMEISSSYGYVGDDGHLVLMVVRKGTRDHFSKGTAAQIRSQIREVN